MNDDNHSTHHAGRDLLRISIFLGNFFYKSLTELLDDIENNYGVTSGGEEAPAEFSAASQKPDEYVVSWAIRLETLENHIKKHGLAAEKEKRTSLKVLVGSTTRSTKRLLAYF